MRPTPGHSPALVFSPAAGETGAILLETQRPDVRDRYSYLLRGPERILAARRREEVVPVLEEAGSWQARGYAVAGFAAYEAGYALESAFESTPFDETGSPLVWLGVYGGFLRYDHLSSRWARIGRPVPPWPIPPDPRDLPVDASPVTPRFSLTEEDHRAKVEEIRGAIAQGDVYQANLTGTFSFPLRGDPFSFYLRLRAAQPVAYGAFLRTDRVCVVSQSPELFFRVRGDRIEARSMKGTAPRGLTDGEDGRAAAALRADPKNRAENVMIVDLLRNDLGRGCRTGSVRAPRLFEVQRFATVLQMVSTVTGRLKAGTTPAGLFRALFPCGSVTGAPKISAMRLLRRTEPAPRGVYTGAIGILLPGGDMTFSVAIRTATVRDGRAEAGSGGGIVWDSKPAGEFREIAQKGRYLIEPPVDFELLETFLWSPGTGFRYLPAHLRRMAASARYFGFRFRRERILSALEGAVRDRRAGPARRVRLLLRRDGDASAELHPLPPAASDAKPFRVTVSGVAVSTRDPFVRHKTTNRVSRDEELSKARSAGFDEVLFLNERGELTEGAITNLFVEIDGRLFTPPLACGLLDGVSRRIVLKERRGGVAERMLFPDDLADADAIYLTNSVRGMIAAVLPAGAAVR
ncbi:MAG: aminodeoxychorismate synthase component I [Deltaproteobacteria bacterium]|nr:aminodeoxychorismate synthase component I [Deltaproteobacteria bacterium]